jgi:3-sulfinopropanoyl-CoA desulfinase
MFSLSPEQLALGRRARELAEHVIAPRAARVDETQEYPWDNVEALVDAGFMGMTIPREHGGKGASFLDAAIVVEEVARVCGVTGRIVVEGNMGAIGAIMQYGSREQKRRAAELVLSGDKPAICITEPEAGSAASRMTTRADKQADGRYVINGAKHWITGGGVSKLHLIFARVFEDGVAQGIGGFMAFRDEDQGLRIGRREPTMGLRGIPETEVLFENLTLDQERLVRSPRGLTRGFADLMTAYNAQRVGAAAVALGVAQGAYDKALEYSQTREQFGRPICEFQGLQWMLVDMSILLGASRALIHRAASGQGGFPDVTEAAQAKIFASEAAIKVTNDALQIFGAAGYSRNQPLERMVRDARMFTIGGGTAQILRTVVASQLLRRKLPQTRDGYLGSEIDGVGT